jgi:hypothetical protein
MGYHWSPPSDMNCSMIFKAADSLMSQVSDGARDSWQPVVHRQALRGGQWLGQRGQLVKRPAETYRSSPVPETTLQPLTMFQTSRNQSWEFQAQLIKHADSV